VTLPYINRGTIYSLFLEGGLLLIPRAQLQMKIAAGICYDACIDEVKLNSIGVCYLRHRNGGA
jgi:hypothetical protein